tara:strand:+ start:102 stop:398 length:297 start_codon:yes stop_codon:yes gene_type:complete
MTIPTEAAIAISTGRPEFLAGLEVKIQNGDVTPEDCMGLVPLLKQMIEDQNEMQRVTIRLREVVDDFVNQIKGDAFRGAKRVDALEAIYSEMREVISS